MNPPVQRLHIWGGGRNPHFSSTVVVCLGSLGLFFGARAHNYHLRGVRAPQRAHSPPEKWEFLLLCESAVIIIIIVPAAKSDPRSCAH